MDAGVDIESILQNYKEEIGVNVEEFDLKDFEDVLKEKTEEEIKVEANEAGEAQEGEEKGQEEEKEKEKENAVVEEEKGSETKEETEQGGEA